MHDFLASIEAEPASFVLRFTFPRLPYQQLHLLATDVFCLVPQVPFMHHFQGRFKFVLANVQVLTSLPCCQACL